MGGVSSTNIRHEKCTREALIGVCERQTYMKGGTETVYLKQNVVSALN